MSQSEEAQPGQTEDTTTVGEQTENIASAAAQTDGPAADANGGRSKVAALAAGTGAAVAGIAGGIAVVARDTRRRVLGVPIGKRNRFQRGASAVVDKVQEPARRLGSRFTRD